MKKLLFLTFALFLALSTNLFAQKSTNNPTEKNTVLGSISGNSLNSVNIKDYNTQDGPARVNIATVSASSNKSEDEDCSNTAPTKVWDKVISQPSTEPIQTNGNVTAVVSTNDGGVFTVIEANGCVRITKTNKNGSTVWSRDFLNISFAPSIKSAVQTTDEGFLLGGYTATNATQPDANFLTKKNARGEATTDFWILKIDANGNSLWSKNFGGNREDLLKKIEKTSDGGYLLGGMTNSDISFDVEEPGFIDNYGNAVTYDYWIVKIDNNGNKLWTKRWNYNTGGTNDYFLEFGAIKEVDTDIVVSGVVWRPTYEEVFGYQYHVLKLNSSRVKQWESVFGKQAIYTGTLDMIIMPDKSFMFAGTSLPNKGSSDLNNLYLVKMNKNGHKQWDKEFNVGNVYSNRVIKNVSNEDEFIVVALSNAGISKNKTEASKGGGDLWINKFDKNGSQIWDKTIGGSGAEFVGSMDINANNEIFLGGYSSSPISGDKSVAGEGAWVVKIVSKCPASSCESASTSLNTNSSNRIAVAEEDPNSMITLQIYPNPAHQEVMIQIDGLNKETKLQILDIFGKVQYQADYQRDMKVSLTKFQSGVYFVRCENIVQKLIVGFE